jgi:hypothetical protein
MSQGQGASFESDRDLGPEGFARAFVDAIAWGEHRRVWELLGREGRRTVLRVAVGRGMDEALSARLRDGTASPSETDAFLADLVNGLRADLAGTDLDTVEYHQDEVAAEQGATWVILTSPLPAALGGEVPVGTMELVQESDAWRVTRLSPRPRP